MRAVLTFHSIDDSADILSFSPANLEKLINGLQLSGIPIVTLDTLLSNPKQSGVSFTFDDGMTSLYQNVLPLMKRYHFPAHLFLTTSVVGGNNRWPTQPKEATNYFMLTWSEIDDLLKAGMHIEAHTDSHPWLTKLTKEEIIDECEKSNRIIEQHTGLPPKYFAYPYGDYDTKVSATIKSIYRASFTTQLRFLSMNPQLEALPRLDSYYLKHEWFYNHFDSAYLQLYMKVRHGLRTFKAVIK